MPSADVTTPLRPSGRMSRPKISRGRGRRARGTGAEAAQARSSARIAARAGSEPGGTISSALASQSRPRPIIPRSASDRPLSRASATPWRWALSSLLRAVMPRSRASLALDSARFHRAAIPANPIISEAARAASRLAGRAVPARPSPGPLGQADRSGRDRSAVEETAEVVGQGVGGGVPPLGLLPQAGQRDRLQVAGHAGHKARGGDGLGRADLVERLVQGRAPVRRAAGQELIQDRPQGMHVGGAAHGSGRAPGLLGGHVGGGAHDRAGPGQLRVVVQELGEAEVGNLRRAVGGDQDVRGLEVAVDNLQAVRLGHAEGHVEHGLNGEPGVPGGAVQAAGQAAAGGVLHHEEGSAVVRARGEHLDDVRVLDPRHGLGLGQESTLGVEPRRRARQRPLQCHDPAEAGLPRAVDPRPPRPGPARPRW